MTPEQQRIAIAEACGKIRTSSDEEYAAAMAEWEKEEPHPHASLTRPTKTVGVAPDYPNDLNAMHEAEKVPDDTHNLLNESEGEETQLDCYVWNLEQVLLTHAAEEDNYKCCVKATAAQRAEAFLRTLSLWEES